MKKVIIISGCIIAFCSIIIVACNNHPRVQGADKDNDFSFAFFTDIHVEYAKSADKGFMQAIDYANSLKPDFVVMGGDLIADALGQSEETALKFYDLYIELSKKFNCPVYNTIGNHEEFGIYPKSGITPDHRLYGDKMYEEKIGQRFYSFNEKGWRFYNLDAVLDTDDRQYIGFIDSVQMAWLEEDLKSVDTLTPLVITSHMPLLTSFSQIRGGSQAQNSRGLVVENSKEVLDLFKDHNLKLVLQGHLHILEEAYINNIHFITGGAVSAKWWEGPMGDMEEGFVLIKVKGEDIEWEYIDYGWEVEK